MGVSMIEHGDMMNRKTVSISQKRQITIPKKFFTKLGFGEEAECFLRGNELVIRPVSPYYGGEFSEQILEDLILQGYEGEELLSRFKEKQRKVRPAVSALLDEAAKAARGEGEFYRLRMYLERRNNYGKSHLFTSGSKIHKED